MNVLFIFVAVLSLILMALFVRKSAKLQILNVLSSIILFAIACVCFANVYGLLGGIITSAASLMCVGLLTAFIKGKAVKGY